MKKINEGAKFDDLSMSEKIALASIPAEFIPSVGLIPDIYRLAKASVTAVGKSALKTAGDLITPIGVTDTGITMPMAKVEMPGSGQGRPGIGTGKGLSPSEIVLKNQRDYISKYLEKIYNKAPKIEGKADLSAHWYRGSIKDDIVASNPKLFPDGLNSGQYGRILAGKVKKVRGKNVVTGDKVNIVNSPVTGKLETA